MSATTLIPVEEYLRSSYDPDREYVEGLLVEREVGELEHGELQSAILAYIRARYRGVAHAVVEVRMQVKCDRFRVPDVTVVVGARPKNIRVFTEPVLAVFEVLSPGDRAGDIEEKIHDYLDFGIRYVCVADPYKRKAYLYTREAAHELKDLVLRTSDPELVVPIGELFDAE